MLDVGKSTKNPEVGDGGPCALVDELWLCMDYLSERLEELEARYEENRIWWNTRLEDMRDRFFLNMVELEDRIKEEREKDKSFSGVLERMKT